MKIARLALFGLLLAGVAGAQEARLKQPREILVQWANYYAARYRVPAALVEAVIEEESGWNPYAISKKGAAGVMQLMPGTAKRFGVGDRFRGDESIRGGVLYLAFLIEEFGGDLRLVTAAYQTGEARIEKRGLDYSSPEVHEYVRRVAKRYRKKVLSATNEGSTRGGERAKGEHSTLAAGSNAGQGADQQHQRHRSTNQKPAGQ